MAADLQTLASLEGRSAWETAHDPHLSFNMTVMRCWRKHRQLRFDMTLPPDRRDFLGRVIAAFRLLFLEGG